jgi:rubrerythrin
MDILEYALKMEKDGERFYRGLAGKTTNKSLQTILTMLAQDEQRHYDTIDALRAGRSQTAQTTILDQAKNVFAQMEQSADHLILGADQIALYKQAQQIERKSRQFYLDNAEKTSSQPQRLVFEILAAEEDKHYFLLENVIEFIGRPREWLENAEWHHLEEY